METKKTFSAGGVVLNQKEEILMTYQRTSSSWSFPKGHVEVGEDALTAAKREILEETGIQVLEPIKELGSYSRYRVGKDGSQDMTELKTITLFLFKTSQVELKPTDPDNPEARWVKREEVVDMLSHPEDKIFFLKALTKL